MTTQSPPGNPLTLSGKVAIVTGGTKGLGRAIAETFLAAGAQVMICARTQPELAIEAAGSEATFIAADVREAEQVQAVVDATVQRYGRIDILINNAGGAPPAPSNTASQGFNEKVVALNLIAPLTFSQAVYRQMQAQGGAKSTGVIINIASTSGTRTNPMGAAYGAAKAGLINLTKTLAHEWGPAVRVLGLTVGQILTEDAQLFYGDDEGIAAVGQVLAMGRLGDPQEVADVALFLCSPLASWMTGTSVEVHGGGENPAYLRASTGNVND
ncbi:MAG: SDR family oxidoreductase [Acidimicrobiales bacterium]